MVSPANSLSPDEALSSPAAQPARTRAPVATSAPVVRILRVFMHRYRRGIGSPRQGARHVPQGVRLGGDAEEHGPGMENARRIDVRGDTHQASVEQPLAATGDGALRQIDHAGDLPPGRTAVHLQGRGDDPIGLVGHHIVRGHLLSFTGDGLGGRLSQYGADSRCATSQRAADTPPVVPKRRRVIDGICHGAPRRPECGEGRRRDRSLDGALVDGCLCYSASAFAGW